MRGDRIGFLGLLWAFVCVLPAGADPLLTSSPPANGASPSAPFVFTFSEAMNTEFTGVDFIDTTTFQTLLTTALWSGGNTVLTCTPTPAFPANRMIVWSAYGENPAGVALSGVLGGVFTTGTGAGGGGGFGTNATTTFSVGKIHHYQQTSAAAPTLDSTTPYGFSGATMLSSNRTALSIELTLPTSSVVNLTQIPLQPEIYLARGFSPTLSAFDTTYPAGDYTFLVKAATSNQTVVVNLPPPDNQAQPGPPHLTNYVAAQQVDASKPFVLGWDAFPGGTEADYIDVDIGGAYLSPEPGMPLALKGTARTFTIPAGALQPNTTYPSQVGFFRFVGTTNATYTTAAYRATYTEFSLITTAGIPLVLTNAAWSANEFSFDVLCSPGQTVTVESTNFLSPGPWPIYLIEVSQGPQLHVTAPQPSASAMFFRARAGP